MEKELVSTIFRIFKYYIKINIKILSDLVLGTTFMEPWAKSYKYILSMLWSKYYYHIHYVDEETGAIERWSNLSKVIQGVFKKMYFF